jgi:hypothetical protein
MATSPVGAKWPSRAETKSTAVDRIAEFRDRVNDHRLALDLFGFFRVTYVSGMDK